MKLPHSLRLVVFLLRVALGLDFFYLGWSTLFNPPLSATLGQRSLTDLYAWIGTSVAPGSYQTVVAWAFLVIGACLVLGLFTRFVSIAGIALTLASYLPGMSYAALTWSQFINDEVLVVICLLVLIFSNAGGYLGIDVFFHWRAARQRKEK